MHSKKELTYHNAPRRLLASITMREEPATRRELEVLFMRHCVGHPMKDFVLAYFQDNELKRVIALELYRANVKVQKKDRYCVVHQITAALGVHKKTVKRWVFDHYPEEKTGDEESKD